MPTSDDLRLHRARQAWWLRIARMTDPREPTLADVAVAAGLKAGSGSVVSLWERDLEKEGPKRSQMVRLAGYYGLPLSLFTDPPESDEERLQAWRREPGMLSSYRDELARRTVDAARVAIELAQRDSQVEAEALDLAAGGLPGAERRRQIA